MLIFMKNTNNSERHCDIVNLLEVIKLLQAVVSHHIKLLFFPFEHYYNRVQKMRRKNEGRVSQECSKFMRSHKVLGQIFVFKALAQCYQSPAISTAAMPDIYLIYSLPKLQSKSRLLKSAVCCAALTNHTGGRAFAEGERGKKAEEETEGRLSNGKRERDLQVHR